MKKVIALITGLLLLSSIIIVSFFGTLAYTKEKNIYCDYVVLNMRNIMNDEKTAVEVLKRGEGDDEYWYGNDYDYRINVRDTKFLIDKKDSQFKLYCEAKTLRPGKLVSEPSLNYFVSEPANWNEYLEGTPDKDQLLNDVVKIKDKTKFIEKTESSTVTPFTIKVQSKDPKGKFIKIRLQIIHFTA